MQALISKTNEVSTGLLVHLRRLELPLSGGLVQARRTTSEFVGEQIALGPFIPWFEAFRTGYHTSTPVSASLSRPGPGTVLGRGNERTVQARVYSRSAFSRN